MFRNLYSLNIFKSKIEGLNNKRLAELALEEAEILEKRKDDNPSATGFEDSPMDPAAPEVRQLRHTIKNIIDEHIDTRLTEGEIWGHVLRTGESTQIHSHRSKQDWDLLNTSWVYYPQIPEGENLGGRIVFQTQLGDIKHSIETLLLGQECLLYFRRGYHILLHVVLLKNYEYLYLVTIEYQKKNMMK